VREWWHKIRGLETFRVKFRAGPKSKRMSYKDCKAYIALFGGTVIFDPFKKE